MQSEINCSEKIAIICFSELELKKVETKFAVKYKILKCLWWGLRLTTRLKTQEVQQAKQ